VRAEAVSRDSLSILPYSLYPCQLFFKRFFYVYRILRIKTLEKTLNFDKRVKKGENMAVL
jgi:hypothetical protein